MDVDVEIKARVALYRRPEQVLRAPALQYRVQILQQVAVFATQVHEAPLRAYHQRSQAHTLDHRIGMAREQHPVLERARFAFVRVTDNVVCAARRVAA